MDIELIGIVFLTFVLSGGVKGAVGFGMPTVAVALLGTTLGVREAIPLVSLPALIANIWQIDFGKGLLPLLQRFWSLNLTIAVGIWLGTAFMTSVDANWLSTGLGAVLVLYAILAMTALRLQVSRAAEPYLSPVMGLVSGIVAGLSGSIIVPLVFYLQALELDRDAFVRVVSVALLVASGFWSAALVSEGLLTWHHALISLAALIPASLGQWGGSWLRRRTDQERFRTWIFIALLLMGLNLLRKGLSPLLGL
jgi:uncharacterized membrane protein YfcA